MSAYRRLIAAALALLPVAACRDAAGPVSPDFEYLIGDETTVITTMGGRGGPTPTPHYALRHAARAPALSAYAVSFWAKRGEARSVSVQYAGNGLTFLTFTVPRTALERGVDGRRLALGDSLLITLTLDPVAFQVEFAPSGLQFSRREPAALHVWYGNMDPDVNRDSVVDGADDALLASGITFYHFDTGGINWSRVASVTDAAAQTIETAVGGFSGYSISW